MVPGCTVATAGEAAGTREAPPGLHRESGHHSSHNADELYLNNKARTAHKLLGDTLDTADGQDKFQILKG